MRRLLLAALPLILAACAGHEKGTDKGVGFFALDTESQASKDNQEWFDSYYGKCHNVWGGSCDDKNKDGSGGGGGGGFWGGPIGPSDAVSHQDSN